MVLGSGIRDPGSGKNLFRIPDPGVKKHPIPDPGSGSATLPVGTILGMCGTYLTTIFLNIHRTVRYDRYPGTVLIAFHFGTPGIL
jgi:hypothetical protein